MRIKVANAFGYEKLFKLVFCFNLMKREMAGNYKTILGDKHGQMSNGDKIKWIIGVFILIGLILFLAAVFSKPLHYTPTEISSLQVQKIMNSNLPEAERASQISEIIKKDSSLRLKYLREIAVQRSVINQYNYKDFVYDLGLMNRTTGTNSGAAGAANSAVTPTQVATVDDQAAINDIRNKINDKKLTKEFLDDLLSRGRITRSTYNQYLIKNLGYGGWIGKTWVSVSGFISDKVFLGYDNYIYVPYVNYVAPKIDFIYLPIKNNVLSPLMDYINKVDDLILWVIGYGKANYKDQLLFGLWIFVVHSTCVLLGFSVAWIRKKLGGRASLFGTNSIIGLRWEKIWKGAARGGFKNHILFGTYEKMQGFFDGHKLKWVVSGILFVLGVLGVIKGSLAFAILCASLIGLGIVIRFIIFRRNNKPGSAPLLISLLSPFDDAYFRDFLSRNDWNLESSSGVPTYKNSASGAIKFETTLKADARAEYDSRNLVIKSSNKISLDAYGKKVSAYRNNFFKFIFFYSFFFKYFIFLVVVYPIVMKIPIVMRVIQIFNGELLFASPGYTGLLIGILLYLTPALLERYKNYSQGTKLYEEKLAEVTDEEIKKLRRG